MDRYATGRVVLLGDAAYGNTLGGFGTGLADRRRVRPGRASWPTADGDHRVAFRRYEEVFRGYATVAQRGNAGPFLAPRSRPRMRLRNSTFPSPFLLRVMLALTDRFATDIDLPDYPSAVHPAR